MLNYEKIKKEQLKKNFDFFNKNYRNDDFQLKIDKYCEKFDISKKDVLNKIASGDKITISIFVKDPAKQNFYEKTAANYIKKLDNVYNFKNLANSGKNAIFIFQDTIRKNNFKIDYKTKTVDFMWKTYPNNVQYYAYHKYIREKGGAQDNQFNDVLCSIKSTKNPNSNSKHKVLFICDGHYFNKKKLNELREKIQNKNHKVLKIEELKEYLIRTHQT